MEKWSSLYFTSKNYRCKNFCVCMETYKITKPFCFKLGHTKLMLCFTDCLPSQGDLAGWEKIKIKVYYETMCITKIAMVAKYLKDTTSVHSQLQLTLHFLATCCHVPVLDNSGSSIFINIQLYAHMMNCQPFQLYWHHMTMIT